MSKETVYKGMILARNSKAYELYHDKNDAGHKALNKHLKEVEAQHKALLERYSVYETK